jgi:hypothetical protein
LVLALFYVTFLAHNPFDETFWSVMLLMVLVYPLISFTFYTPFTPQMEDELNSQLSRYTKILFYVALGLVLGRFGLTPILADKIWLTSTIFIYLGFLGLFAWFYRSELEGHMRIRYERGQLNDPDHHTQVIHTYKEYQSARLKQKSQKKRPFFIKTIIFLLELSFLVTTLFALWVDLFYFVGILELICIWIFYYEIYVAWLFYRKPVSRLKQFIPFVLMFNYFNFRLLIETFVFAMSDFLGGITSETLFLQLIFLESEPSIEVSFQIIIVVFSFHVPKSVFGCQNFPTTNYQSIFS